MLCVSCNALLGCYTDKKKLILKRNLNCFGNRRETYLENFYDECRVKQIDNFFCALLYRSTSDWYFCAKNVLFMETRPQWTHEKILTEKRRGRQIWFSNKMLQKKPTYLFRFRFATNCLQMQQIIFQKFNNKWRQQKRPLKRIHLRKKYY